MKLRLFPRLLVFILVPCILCMLVMTSLNHRQASNVLKTQIEGELRHISELQAAEIEMYFGILWGVGKEFAVKSEWLQLLSAEPNSPDYALLVQQARKSLSTTADILGFGVAGLLDRKGIAIAHTHDISVGVDFSDRAYFKEAMQTGKQSYQTVISRTTGAMAVIMAIPVLEPGSNRIVGISYFNINLERFGNLTTNKLRMGESGLAFVMDGNGKFVMHPDKEMLGQDATRYDWARSMLLGGSGILEFEWNGIRKNAGYAKVPSLNLTMVMTVDVSDHMRPVDILYKNNLVLTLCSVILVALVVFFVARGVSGSLQYVVALARKIEAGNFKFSNEELQRNAEVLKKQDEVAELIGGIDHMRGNLERLFEESEQKTITAEKANKAKTEYLSNISHEIRTPLNAILGVTEIQLNDETLVPDMREAFGMVYNSGNMLLNIINDVLDISKAEAGKLELAPAEYEIASLIYDTAQVNMVRIGDKPIEFELRVDENTPAVVVGDGLRVKQILNNVLSNAFKYTQKGVIKLSVFCETEQGDGSSQRVLSTLESGKEVPDVTLVFRVSDTGQGMTAEQVSRIFDVYARFNLEVNRTIEGVGLGMSITQSLVRLMNGEILVESEPGRGSTFTVRLPQGNIGAGVLGKELAEHLCNFDFSIQRMTRTPILREPMPYGSVLIVDDVETNLYVARGLMGPYKLSIDTASSGFEAIDKIQGGKVYDIVFMDHMMPKMDGVETTKHLRDLGYTSPIVALTANAVVGQAEMFLENGLNGFLSKPIDLRQLNALLNRLIRDKQPPEVIEAMRRQKDDADDKVLQPSLDGQLAKIFVQDAEMAIAALEAICINRCRRDDDVQRFVINVHAMKSALANISEQDLSAVALRLEQVGRDADTAAMLDETPAFLEALRALIKKIRPREKNEGSETADEDQAYLREKLFAIQTACAVHDKKTIKSALTELRQKVWSRPTKERLEVIAQHLLHSNFETIESVVDEMIDSPSSLGETVTNTSSSAR